MKSEFLQKLLEGKKVEWRTLGEVCEIKTGGAISKDFISKNVGKYPVINSGVMPLGFVNTYNTENDPIGITSRGAGVGSITWREGKYFRGNLNYSCTIKNVNVLLIRYIFHLLNYMQQEIQSLCTYQGIPALNKCNLENLIIPIPPMEVQMEVVRILDLLTSHTTQLKAELKAELTARKKQYEYYRNKLLTFDEDEVEWKALGEVAKIKNGKDWKNLGNGNIPVYGSGGIMCYVNCYAYDKPTVLIPRKGSITNIFYLETPFWNVDTIYYTEIDTSQIIPKFMYYYIKTIDLMALDSGSGRPSLTQAILNEISIPIPPLSKQQEIVEVLDKFNALTNSITEGLPREIELRQKQYEYYRNLLLNYEK